ncbi:MAG TPA: sugar transferase [Candidatus Eisenbacteria bacterium]|nr:sugar transferase [Candidatus Eisenbacteria bacterium]
MIRRHAGALRALLATVDALVVLFSLGLAAVVRFGFQAPLDSALSPFSEGIALVLPVAGWPIILWAHGLYRPRARLTIRGEALDVLRATTTFTAAVLIALYFFKLDDFSRTVVAVFVPTLALSTIAVRIALRAALSALRDRGRNTRHVLVLGTAAGAQWFADRLETHSELGLQVIGHLTGQGEARVTVSRPILGTLDEIEDVLHSRIVDEVAICLPLTEASRIDSIVRLCEEEGKIVRIPMQVFEHALAAGRVEELDGVPIYSIVSGPDRLAGFIAKRAVDILGAIAAGILLSPVMIGLAIAIRVESPGPILFVQRRVGLHGRTFDVVKFRTMIDGAEGQVEDLLQHNEIKGHAFKVTNDPRVTRVGRFIRRTSLDELPQLLNVLRGEMSLVGPRPPLPTEVAGYDVWHRRRLSMKPGMTGLWQVRARREPDFDRWVETDLEYIDSWSFWLDVKIMARTIPAMLLGDGR